MVYYSPDEFVTLVEVLLALGKEVAPCIPRDCELLTDPLALGPDRPGAPEPLLAMGPLMLDELDEVAVASYCNIIISVSN